MYKTLGPRSCVALLLSFASAGPLRAETGRLPSGVTPISYDISVAPDAAKLTFTGEETITIDVAASSTVLTLNAAELSIGAAVLDDNSQGKISVDASSQTASFTFPRPVSRGRHKLKLSWTGKINQSAAGLFAVDYAGVDGRDARMLVTQFEAPDARRSLVFRGTRTVSRLVESPLAEFFKSTISADFRGLLESAVSSTREPISDITEAEVSSRLRGGVLV